MKVFTAPWISLSFLLVTAIACSSADRDRKPEEAQRWDGVASGVHESEALTEGLTAIWWSKEEDFFVAGLHKDQSPEPAQVGLYFGSIKDESKRKIHWFQGGSPAGEDLVAVRTFKDEKSKNRVYLLKQLQNAGYYFPAFYYFSLDTWMPTALYSKINCEQIEDLDFTSAGLNINCRIPPFGAEEDFVAEELVAKAKAKKKGAAAKAAPVKAAEDDPAESEEELGDSTQISLDVDPSVSYVSKITGEQHRDWLTGVLRSCVQTGKGEPKICYPR